ncbi:MAG: hypothetical protein P1U37_10600 [Minwuia sp.]|nr:hypothetical protein [Minwuia sp.]
MSNPWPHLEGILRLISEAPMVAPVFLAFTLMMLAAATLPKIDQGSRILMILVIGVFTAVSTWYAFTAVTHKSANAPFLILQGQPVHVSISGGDVGSTLDGNVFLPVAIEDLPVSKEGPDSLSAKKFLIETGGKGNITQTNLPNNSLNLIAGDELLAAEPVPADRAAASGNGGEIGIVGLAIDDNGNHGAEADNLRPPISTKPIGSANHGIEQSPTIDQNHGKNLPGSRSDGGHVPILSNTNASRSGVRENPFTSEELLEPIGLGHLGLENINVFDNVPLLAETASGTTSQSRLANDIPASVLGHPPLTRPDVSPVSRKTDEQELVPWSDH